MMTRKKKNVAIVFAKASALFAGAVILSMVSSTLQLMLVAGADRHVKTNAKRNSV